MMDISINLHQWFIHVLMKSLSVLLLAQRQGLNTGTDFEEQELHKSIIRKFNKHIRALFF